MVYFKISIIKLIDLMRPACKYLLAGWALIIMTVSSIPSIPTLKLHAGELTLRLDYLIHFLEYATLAILAYVTFSERNVKIRFRKSSVITLLLIVFAFADEFHQKWIPGRSYNPADIISDITGIFAALVVFILIMNRNKYAHS